MLSNRLSVFFRSLKVVVMESRSKIEAFRLMNNEALPRWYHWGLHFFANSLILLCSGCIAVFLMESWTPRYFGALFIGFLIWSLIEYLIHRFILHGQWFSSTRLYQQHSIYHHQYFNHEYMSAEKSIDTNRVLIFTSDLITLIAVNGFLSAGLGLLTSRDLGLLFFLAGILYIAVYEVAHAVSHQRSLSNLPILRKNAKHHRDHHHPSLMARKNFSVVLPFWDRVLGSSGDKHA